MTGKSDRKRRQEKQTAAKGGSAQEAERLIQKGWLKDAVKQAKLVYRDAATPENHRLLERAYFLRAQELQRASMPTAAAEVAQHLLDFGVTDPALPAQLAPLLLAVGLSSEAMALGERLESPEDQARLIQTAADQAVLHPERIGAAASFAEIREGASLVRSALSALDAGEEADALERLRPIARSSPFADWRYFVRGLAALRRRDSAQVDAQWDRLEPGRAAARIARTLRSLSADAGATAAANDTGVPNLSALETAVFGEPLLAPLERLQQAVAEKRWADVIPLLPALRVGLQRVDPRLAERLTRTLLLPLVDETGALSAREGRQLVGSFVKAVEPLPLDPHWNRLRAIIAEGPQSEEAEFERFWQAYLADLATLPSLTPEQRRRAQALVWEHQGLFLADLVEDLTADFGPPRLFRQLDQWRARAIQCLEESRRLDPTYLGAYESLIDLLDEWGRDDQANAAAAQLLEQFPNHEETLGWLAQRYMRDDDPEQALPLLQRARALKPLDEALRDAEWTTHVALARKHALKRRWAKGRDEFALAETLQPELSKQYFFAARRAVFELKAGQDDSAEEWIKRAQQELVEPTPLWLVMLIEGTRYRLPKTTLTRFKKLWESGLSGKGKRKSETAGELAEVLSSYLDSGVKYTGQSGHVQQLISYLKRPPQISYRRDDLIRVCAFLHGEPKGRGLLEKLVDRGLKDFPESSRLHFIAGVLEFESGPFLADLNYAQDELRKALELAQVSTDPKETQLTPKLKEILSKIDALSSRPMGMPFGDFNSPFPGGDAESPDFFDVSGAPAWYDPFWDDDEDDDDEDEDDAPPPPPSRRSPPTPRRSASGKSKSKSGSNKKSKKK